MVCDVPLSFVSPPDTQEIDITSQCSRRWVVSEVL